MIYIIHRVTVLLCNGVYFILCLFMVILHNRSVDSTIRLLWSEVEDKHVVIFINEEDGTASVTNLCDSNPAKLNGKPLSVDETLLNGGDRLTINDQFTFIYQW